MSINQDSNYNIFINSKDAAAMDQSGNQKEEDGVPAIKIYRKRWLILTLFCLVSMTNGYQWIHLSIIPLNVEALFNSTLPIGHARAPIFDLVSMIFMIVYVPLILPATLLLDRKGLRITILLGAVLNALGAWIKCFSLLPLEPKFWVLMLGQTVAAAAQSFILGMPPIIAATWFGRKEVSTATSLGVFGNQIGIALGFILPPIIVNAGGDAPFNAELARFRYNIMFYAGAAFMTLLCFLVVLVFDEQPELPPTHTRRTVLELLHTQTKLDFVPTIRNLFRNRAFIALLFCYGINTGTYYTLSTLISEIFHPYFPKEEKLIGIEAFSMLIAGIVGSVIMGLLMDRTKRYKLINNIVYVGIFVSMVSFTGFLLLESIHVMFVIMLVLGFFMTGYLSIGFEYAAEITYPENEGISSSFINCSAMVFGLVFTYSYTFILSYTKSSLYGNLLLCLALLIGTAIKVSLNPSLRRQAAYEDILECN